MTDSSKNGSQADYCRLFILVGLGGSMFASVLAGLFADLLGRKLMMLISPVMFVTSVVIDYTSQTYITCCSAGSCKV